MRIIRKETSTNGRYGITVVGDVADDFQFPAKGVLTDLGKIEGHQTFKFTPNDSGQWIHVVEDVKPLVGCVIVFAENLQSNNHVAVLAGGSFHAFKEYGYKRRSSIIRAYNNGQQVDLPAEVMAAMGLIQVEEKVIEIDMPEMESPIAEALRKAGII